MSHAVGEVISGESVLGYYEYDGTSDRVLPAIWNSQDDVVNHWRNQPERFCRCGHEPIPVLLWSSYGGGFYWPGTACLECKAIVSVLTPYEHFERGSGWPKRGHPLLIAQIGARLDANSR